MPVDSVTGSSSGSAVAAVVALGLEEAEGRSFFTAILESVKPSFSRFTFPIAAVMSGVAPTEALKRVRGDVQI